MRKILVAVFIFFILIAANFQVVRNAFVAPKDTFYTGAMGFFFDYYQFLSWMRDGESGQFLLSSRYIPSRESGVLLHPLFPLLGAVAKVFAVPRFIMYHIARNVFLFTWIGSIVLLSLAFSKEKCWRFALLFLIFFASSFPSLTLSPIIPFWETFYTLEKFIIPPHHLLANTLFLLLIVLIVRSDSRKRSRDSRNLGLSIPGILLFLANPVAASFLLFLLGIVFLFEGTRFRKLFLLLFFSVLPFALYNYVIFRTEIPWKYYYEGEVIGRYAVTFFEYLLSLGPLFFTALFSFFYVGKFRLLEKMCAVWLILGPLLFPFVGRQIPFSMSRLFALNLFIPSAVLTVFFLRESYPPKGSTIWYLPKLYAKVDKLMMVRWGRMLIIIFLSISLAFGLSYSLKNVFFSHLPFYYNIFLPKEFVTGIDFLKKNTTSVDSVIAGQNISSLIPAFTPARVVLGRLDAYPDYEKVKSEVDDIYFRRIADNQILIRLNKWHVKYILFGLEHINYELFLQKGKIERIDEVWRSGNIVIAQVRY